MILYIGPGVSLATFIIVFIVLAIVFASLAIVLFRPLKRFVQRIIKD